MHRGEQGTSYRPLLLCRRVQGLDATAARTIGTLYGTLRGRDVHLLIANLAGGETARLLRSAVLVLTDQAEVQRKPLLHVACIAPGTDLQWL
jgi:hypothetical protein